MKLRRDSVEQMLAELGVHTEESKLKRTTLCRKFLREQYFLRKDIENLLLKFISKISEQCCNFVFFEKITKI